MTKSLQIQIRVSPDEKAAIKRLALAAGLDVSTYMLMRALPPARRRFAEILRALENEAERRFALAELNDLLVSISDSALTDAVEDADVAGLSGFVQNYVAAMVELAASNAGVAPPPWTVAVEPLEEPYFATPLESLRLHLLHESPVPFRRRNMFIDASLGARV
ncbi:MAG: hypothetical protein V3S56_01990 [Gemmatimonadota bacterium]